MLPELLEQKLETLPTRPGCYLFKDRDGGVLYVGKATSLRSRVRSYFQEGSSDTRGFIPLLRKHVQDLETIVTSSEKEATILEDSLIKKHKPRFNVKLRDDKSYLSLRLDLNQDYPRLELVRRPQRDGARYFGPHHSATAARRTLHFINKHFQLRTCSDQQLASRTRPCIQFQIKRCPAPCVFEIDKARYKANAVAVALFLDGKHDDLMGVVEERMREASANMDFEIAAVYRDQIRAIQSVLEGQRVVAVSNINQDVIGYFREADSCEITIAFVRAGRVVNTSSFSMRRVELPDEELVGAVLAQYYGPDGPASEAIPDEILVPILPEGALGVEEWLSERRGRKAKLIFPKRGARVDLLRLAMENAEHAFAEKRRTAGDMKQRLTDIQTKLRLPSIPTVIECCDISHLGGQDTVGGVVRMLDGEFHKAGYRAFHVRQATEGDDYAAIFEVLSRRFRRALEAELAKQNEIDSEIESTSSETPSENNADGWTAPDLFVVDGGRGQLTMALTAARELGLHDLPIVALAKEREDVTGQTLTDRVYLPGQKNGISVRTNSALVLLARLRDEAHRYSNSVREKLGLSRRLRSQLDEAIGIGEGTRRKLLTHFGTVQAVAAASDEELREKCGLTRRQVRALRELFLEPSVGTDTKEAPGTSAPLQSDLAPDTKTE